MVVYGADDTNSRRTYDLIAFASVRTTATLMTPIYQKYQTRWAVLAARCLLPLLFCGRSNFYGRRRMSLKSYYEGQDCGLLRHPAASEWFISCNFCAIKIANGALLTCDGLGHWTAPKTTNNRRSISVAIFWTHHTRDAIFCDFTFRDLMQSRPWLSSLTRV